MFCKRLVVLFMIIMSLFVTSWTCVTQGNRTLKVELKVNSSSVSIHILNGTPPFNAYLIDDTGSRYSFIDQTEVFEMKMIQQGEYSLVIGDALGRTFVQLIKVK